MKFSNLFYLDFTPNTTTNFNQRDGSNISRYKLASLRFASSGGIYYWVSREMSHTNNQAAFPRDSFYNRTARNGNA